MLRDRNRLYRGVHLKMQREADGHSCVWLRAADKGGPKSDAPTRTVTSV